MNDIRQRADKLLGDLSERKRGYQKRLVDFVREYSGDRSLEKIVIKSNFGLNVSDLEKSQSAEDDIRNIVNQVVQGYSRDKIREVRGQRLKNEAPALKSLMEEKKVAFSCKGLTKNFGGKFTLSPISLELRKGDITAVVGENANGKTTFFNLVAGLIKPSAGELSYPCLTSKLASDVDWVEVKNKIAYVPQELPSWYGDLEANLQYEAASHGVTGEENCREVDFVIDRLGLRDHLKTRWKKLSGGTKFRFALAKALVWKPELMILDEPLANLDVNAQLSVLQDIKSLATSVVHPIAVFISSQHIHEVESIADNMLFLRYGTPVFNDNVKRLGLNRTANVFEIGSNLAPGVFSKIFPEVMPIAIDYNGMHYVVTSDLDITAETILQLLINAGAPPHYFRDISRSSKRLFNQRAVQAA